MHGTRHKLASVFAPYRAALREQIDYHRTRFERNRTLWEMMIWSFAVYQGLVRDGFFFSEAVARTAEEDDGQAEPSDPPVPGGVAARFEAPSHPEHEQTDDADPALQATKLLPQDFVFTVADGSGVSLAKAIGSGSHVARLPFPDAGLINIQGGSTGFVSAAFGPAPLISLDPFEALGITPETFDPEQLSFFDGLGTFTGQLGFGIDGVEGVDLVLATPDDAHGLAGAATTFSQEVLSPIGYWQEEGSFEDVIELTTADIFNVDWAVQLNGVLDGTAFSATQLSGFEDATLDMSHDTSDKSFGNEATVTDGDDWSGALAVAGDYYEFNTIIQFNVLWDNDTITIENYDGGGTEEVPAVDSTLAAATTPADETPMSQDSTPVVYSAPTEERTPAVETAVVVEDTPVSEDTSASSTSAPPAAPQQTAESTPVVASTTSVESEPLVASHQQPIETKPVVESPPATVYESVKETEPVDVYEPAVAYEPVIVKTGENTQKNTAEIASYTAPAPGVPSNADEAPHQYFAGGVSSSTSVVQANVIKDVDEISYEMDEMLGDTIGSLDFANVHSAGHDQANTSTVVTAANPGQTKKKLLDFVKHYDDGPLSYVAGDYYELNTVVQVNAAFDRDTIVKTALDNAADAAADTGGPNVVASGGFMQFNSARIEKDDKNDDLFVGGRYSEFNLVLQINVLDDSDIIKQVHSNKNKLLSKFNLDHYAHDDDKGDDGGHGKGMSQFALPSVFDDPMDRGADMMG